MEIVRRGRFWAVHDGAGQLVCVAVYKKGAREVVKRLSPAEKDAPANAGAARMREEKDHGTRHTSDDLHR